MKKIACAVVLAGLLGATGCAYAGVAVTPDNKAVIARNDTFLFGLLRKVFVCQVTPAGVSQCSEMESP